MKFINKIHQIWKDKDLRKKILFVLGMLAIYRIAAHIPVPGANIEALRDFFDSNAILGLLNVFSGGGMKSFSVVALGVGPFITASIIMQLLTMIVPSLEELSKEPCGHQKINSYTRWVTIPLAFIQSFSIIKLLQQSSRGIIADLDPMQYVTTVFVLTGGTIFLMWIGELISEKKVGNGVSLIIFAGIVAALPEQLQRTIATFTMDSLIPIISFLVIAIVTIAGVVFVTEAQRNIPVSYAKRVRGNKMYGGFDTTLPLKVNQAGMIPIIFAVALVTFPPLIAQFFTRSNSEILKNIAQFTIDIFQNQIFYGVVYFLLVFGFTYFYTAVIFHPHQIAENLQKQGGFVPGMRPGRQTAEYLGKVSSRIMLAGALFLGLIAVLPLVIRPITGVTTMAISGASLLIVVSVVLETVRQIDSQLVMRDYEGL